PVSASAAQGFGGHHESDCTLADGGVAARILKLDHHDSDQYRSARPAAVLRGRPDRARYPGRHYLQAQPHFQRLVYLYRPDHRTAVPDSGLVRDPGSGHTAAVDRWLFD